MALYGFHNLQDILSRRAATVDERTISDAIRLAVEAYNQDVTVALSAFATPVTNESVGVLPGDDGAELQGLDEWGRPLPRRMPAKVSRRFPIFMAGDSIASNYVTEQKMTVQEVNDRVEFLTLADNRWMRRQLLSALFTPAPYNFNDPEKGVYQVFPLANDDAETYFRSSSNTSGIDLHHKANAGITTAVLADIGNEIREHPENSGEIVVFVPTASVPAVKALPGYTTGGDPNVSLGQSVDTYVGSIGANAPGAPFGYDSDAMVHLREWSSMPANYLLGVSVGGTKPLAMRQDEEPSLQGFHEIPGREDMPYLQRMWIRRAGFGALNRVGAVVYRTNNATYAAPAGLSAPN